MIRGTTHDQDARFSDKTKKMLEKSQWPDKYDIKIDLSKVDVELIKVWIQKKLTTLMGEEDDIVSGTIISIIEQSLEKEEKLNAKNFHVAICGFLQEKTLLFVSQLWDILEDAQRSARGIPQCLLEEKKKTEEAQRRKLQEINAKRYKINSSKFSNVVKRFTNNRQDQKDERQHKKKKSKHRSRSRSRSRSGQKRKKHRHSEQKKKKKHRSRGDQRSQQKNRDSKDKEKEEKKQSRKPKDENPPEGDRKQKRKRDKSHSERSDSSEVISSSNSRPHQKDSAYN